jgi:hypothetical protein
LSDSQVGLGDAGDVLWRKVRLAPTLPRFLGNKHFITLEPLAQTRLGKMW